MATIFTANSSGILVDNNRVEGVRAVDYRVIREQSNVHALGSHERVAVYYGPALVQGRIRVASADAHLDELTQTGAAFQVVANLRHAQSARSVAFDECVMTGKEFALSTGGHGETIYEFSATRVREEAAEQPAAAG
ncbi:MAG: hypothetical protein ABW321_25440 [Polyangiales bacterium]